MLFPRCIIRAKRLQAIEEQKVETKKIITNEQLAWMHIRHSREERESRVSVNFRESHCRRKARSQRLGEGYIDTLHDARR